MSNEEMNKKMEFVIEQQAQFAANIGEMREVQAEDGKFLKEQYRELSGAVITVVGLVGSLAKAQALGDERINELTQAQAHTDDRINVLVQSQTRTDERINLLTEAQTHLTDSQTQTEERINLLTDAQTRLTEAQIRLTEAQSRTDERLNIFINVVERHISGNGGSENRV
jgi:hypothetical protein